MNRKRLIAYKKRKNYLNSEIKKGYNNLIYNVIYYKFNIKLR